MDHKYTAIVFAVLLASTQAQVNNAVRPSVVLGDLEKWQDVGHSANVNEYFDRTLEMLKPLFPIYGLEPMGFPDIIERFEVNPVLITYSADLRLYDGALKGLTNVARSGDQMVYYFANMLRARVELKFSDLEFDFKYLIKVMNIGPTGSIVGSLESLSIVADILLDFNNDEIHLQEFSMKDIGRLRVRLSGNILYDWLVNPFIAVFVAIIDNTVMEMVEMNVRIAMYAGLDSINGSIKEVMRDLEALNNF